MKKLRNLSENTVYYIARAIMFLGLFGTILVNSYYAYNNALSSSGCWVILASALSVYGAGATSLHMFFLIRNIEKYSKPAVIFSAFEFGVFLTLAAGVDNAIAHEVVYNSIMAPIFSGWLISIACYVVDIVVHEVRKARIRKSAITATSEEQTD